MLKYYKSLATIGCVLSVIFFCVGTIFVLLYIQDIQEQRFIQPIPKELGINSSHDFHRYVNQTFVEGMSRQEIYEELEKFGEYKITPTAWGFEGEMCELVGFPTGQTVIFPKREYLACFSVEDDILISWALRD